MVSVGRHRFSRILRAPAARRGSRGIAAVREPGVTLIELLVVVTILVIAAGMIVPRMGRSLGRMELREAAGRFAHTARTVRELAVASREPWAIEIDLDEGAYRVARGSSGGGGASGQQDQGVRASWLKSEQWPKTIRPLGCRKGDGSTQTTGMVRLTFAPDGTSSGTALRLGADKDEFEVQVHPHNGRVVVGEPGDPAFSPDQYDLGD